jgi:hypothetical protein
MLFNNLKRYLPPSCHWWRKKQQRPAHLTHLPPAIVEHMTQNYTDGPLASYHMITITSSSAPWVYGRYVGSTRLVGPYAWGLWSRAGLHDACYRTLTRYA